MEEQIEYKVVESSDVSDLTLEKILNEWVSQGWRFESMQFVVRDASRRPAMAFILFTRARQGG
ncbi:MAG: DUF4177 domain-containing protein [Deltaproteobacteria bacterium]|nr:DUF4177 domain-containing protein [Deltaproteobacteria bacterium]